jgi:hypothetical protein
MRSVLSYLERLIVLLDRPYHTPSCKEEGLARELRQYVMNMRNEGDNQNLTSSSINLRWLDNLNLFRDIVIRKDPRDFIHWKVIRDSMFVSNVPYINDELKYLKCHKEWSRIKEEIKESRIGRPIPAWKYPNSSPNLIHHMYHICQFEDRIKYRVKDFKIIVEFGGGYGCMCRLLHAQGFNGKYIIYDLPEFAALQQYYLRLNSISVKDIKSFEWSESGVFCVSKLEALKNVINTVDIGNSMFIAMWSLSEVPKELRYLILQLIHGFKGFLIAYQVEFEGIKNHQFFMNWANQNNSITWQNCQITYLTGNYYLIGFQA